MNIVLWIIQIILAIKFITITYTHGLHKSKSTMKKAIQRMGTPALPLLNTISILTLIGALGLILPTAFNYLTWIVPLTATILALLMLLSIIFHIKCLEKPKIYVSIVLFILLGFIFYGRWFLILR